MLELVNSYGQDSSLELLQIHKQLSKIEDSLKLMSITDGEGLWSGDLRNEPLRLQLQHRCMYLQKMLSTPHDVLRGLAQAHHVEAALRYASHNRLAKYVPSDESISFESLAGHASVDVDQCKRIVRLLVSHHVFSEPVVGSVCHSPASRMLLSPDVNAWIQYQTTDSLKSSTCLTEALQKWPASTKPNETAFNLGHGVKLPMFEFFNTVPGKLDRFRRAMTGMAQNPGSDVQHAVLGYKWGLQPLQSCIVDVGGGRGHVATAISESFPDLRITVQDIGISDNQSQGAVNFINYDFFTPQPIHAAQVYFLRQILHDWPDEQALKILRNQIEAMSRNSKLVIMDLIMPEPGELTILEERQSR